MRHPYKNGMSLVELILAILLLNVVILTGISMELGLRRIYTSTDVESQLLGETAPIIAMITKDINRGIGDSTNPPVSYPYDTTCVASAGSDPVFCIHADSSGDGIYDPMTDKEVAYRFHPSANELWYYMDASAGGYSILSGKVTGFSVVPQPANGTAVISLSVRKDPTQAVNATNPELNITSEAQFREFSIS